MGACARPHTIHPPSPPPLTADSYFTGIESYTLSGPPKPTAIRVSPGAATGTFPGNYNFSASATGGRDDIPEDQVVVTYGSIETFTIRFGGIGGSGRVTEQLFGVAFEELPFKDTSSNTTGGVRYTINYNANGGTGPLPANHTGPVGTMFTVGPQSSLARPGYTFGGWNTKADGTGEQFAPGSPISMPKDGATLFAQWDPNPPTAANDVYTCTFNATCSQGARAIFANDTSFNPPSISAITNGPPSVPGALVVRPDGSFDYTPTAA